MSRHLNPGQAPIIFLSQVDFQCNLQNNKYLYLKNKGIVHPKMKNVILKNVDNHQLLAAND